MRLNGHIYLPEGDVTDILEDIVSSLVAGDYMSISSALKTIRPQNAKHTATHLYKILDKFVEFFNTETYIRCEEAIELLKGNMHNSKQTEVALYITGAYGVKTRADDETTERYIFNVCLHICAVKLEEMQDSMS